MLEQTQQNSFGTRIYALGGLGEVGKNTYVIENNQEIILIDAGIKFPDSELLGIGAIIPNYSHLKANRHKLRAIFVTHGHEDHIGGIPYLLNEVSIPFIYASHLTRALIEAKLNDKKISNFAKTQIKTIRNDLVVRTKTFVVTFFPVNHSIPDSYGVVVETKDGIIVSTGDFKFDLTNLSHRFNFKLVNRISESKVTLLLSDSTNSEVTGYTITEKKVIENINNLFKNSKGRILVSIFASNLYRIKQIVELANAHERKVLILGYSLKKIINIIHKIGHLKIKQVNFLTPDQARRVPLNKILVICTGSQGETESALARISRSTNQDLQIIPGDTVILSSSAIPGNKIKLEQLVNRLIKLGANVEENSLFNLLHTSGHAAQEEQKLMISLFTPTYFFPMHGTYRMLKTHSFTAETVGLKKENIFVLENGEQILMKKGFCFKLPEKINAEPNYIDGMSILKITTSAIVKEREILSTSGLIVIVLKISDLNSKLVKAKTKNLKKSFYFTVIKKGFLYLKGHEESIDKKISKTIREKMKKFFQSKWNLITLKKELKTELSNYFLKINKQTPLIAIIID